MSELATIDSQVGDQSQDLPILGDWYYVVDKDDKSEYLMVCNHVGSNHANFAVNVSDLGSATDQVMDSDYQARLRPAPEWQSVIVARIEAAKSELTEAVKALGTKCADSDLLPNHGAVQSDLSIVVATDPVVAKNRLMKIRDEDIPLARESVDRLTKSIVGEYKNMVLGDKIRAEALMDAAKGVEDRLFALELYAGFEERVLQISDGCPAIMETPITIKQMLRFMDEETLIAAEDGGFFVMPLIRAATCTGLHFF